MKTEKFPITITEKGVSAVVRKAVKLKGGKTHNYFIVEFILLGKRKQVWRSDIGSAKSIARDACIKIANGDQSALELKDTDRTAYVRAVEALSPVRVPIDTACREYADALQILGGRASIIEACREWVKKHASQLADVQVSKAVGEILHQSRTDGKTRDRVIHMAAILNRFVDSFNVRLQSVSPSLLSQYLAGLPFAERTRRNHRDMIGFFNRFCVMRGYLEKGTDWLEGVQNYTARKLGEIEIYTPDEMKLLLKHADKRMIPFLVIGAFAGLRHAEIARLDWSEIDLEDGYIEIRAEKAKTQTRRLVPIKNNLKAWLLSHRKAAGKVCIFENTAKQLSILASDAAVPWKHNGLRHSAISYRIAECGDVPRVSDESGNSVQVIRSNYLRRVKPAFAADWFSIMPPRHPVKRKLVVTG